jgi:hypothetical protein
VSWPRSSRARSSSRYSQPPPPSLPAPVSEQPVVEQLLKLDSWVDAGLSESDFNNLLTMCSCGFVMTYRMFGEHSCPVTRAANGWLAPMDTTSDDNDSAEHAGGHFTRSFTHRSQLMLPLLPTRERPVQVSESVLDQLLKLDSWVGGPGLSASDFKKLFAKCACGFVVTSRKFEEHICAVAVAEIAQQVGSH